MPPVSPRLARWLLRIALRETAYEAIAGDLEEEFHEMHQRTGAWRARLWYWIQTLRSIYACRASTRRDRHRPDGDGLMRSVISDIRYGLRLLLRQPGYAFVASGTIALGIGTTVAISSIAYGVLLRPLPYHDEARVVTLWETDPANGFPRKGPSPPNYLDWLHRARSFESIGALAPYEATLTDTGEPVRLTGRRTTASVFSALGVVPALGRAFTVADERTGNGVVIISHRLWTAHFRADPSLVGRAIRLNDNARIVVGVMGADFRLPGRQEDVLIPFVFLDSERQARGSHFTNVVARLRPGAGLSQAQSEMDTIAAALAAEYPRWNAREGALVEPIRQSIAGEVRIAVFVITGAAMLVLLIACVNVTNLQLARGVVRTSEMAVRRALGAGRMRLARQLLTESAVVAGIGGLLGLLLAWAGIVFLRSMLPPTLADIADLGIDRAILWFAAAVTMAAGLVAGVVPAAYASRSAPRTALSDSYRTTIGVAAARARQALVAAEVTLAVLLLVGSGLLLRSFARLSALDPGFGIDNRLTFRVELPRGRYGAPAKWSPFLDSLVERLQSLPGVIAAGGTSWLPLTDSGGSNALFVEGRPLPAPGEAAFAIYRLTTTGYFKAVGIPLLRGRLFEQSDSDSSARVVVVNDTLARRLWPAEEAIGKRVTFSRNPSARDWMTVVGVVGDARITGLAEPVAIAMYAPQTQEPFWFPPTHMVVRTAGDPLALVAAVREQVRSLDPTIPVSEMKTAEAILGEHVAEPRFQSLLVTSFGAAALALSAIGIYGMLAFSTASRTREFGVRLAMGATPGAIVRLVVVSGARVAGVGLIAGLALAAIASRWLEDLLYGVKPSDAIAYGAAAAILAGLALATCTIPARRAANIEPAAALRTE